VGGGHSKNVKVLNKGKKRELEKREVHKGEKKRKQKEKNLK